MLPFVVGGLGMLFTFGSDAASAAIGWTWEKVTVGIFTWLANGLALLFEWIWGMLDTAATPRVTEGWFRNDLAGQVMGLALVTTVALMLVSAAQAALAGRPEQIGDVLKEGPKATVASALTITVIDLLIGIVDEASAVVWEIGRGDLATMIEAMAVVITLSGPLGTTFIGPLLLLMGLVGLLGLAVSLLMRNALIYVVAALAPLVWASSVLPVFRGSARRLVHLLVALVFSKLAIVVTLVVAVKLITSATDQTDTESLAEDAAAAVGMLLTGFTCFLVAAVSPFILYKLMPTVEGAAVSSGIAGGWGRSAMTAAQGAMLASSAGGALGGGAATRAVAGQGGVQGAQGVQGALTSTGGAGSSGTTAHLSMASAGGGSRRQTTDGEDTPSPPSSSGAGSQPAGATQTPEGDVGSGGATAPAGADVGGAAPSRAGGSGEGAAGAPVPTAGESGRREGDGDGGRSPGGAG